MSEIIEKRKQKEIEKAQKLKDELALNKIDINMHQVEVEKNVKQKKDKQKTLKERLLEQKFERLNIKAMEEKEKKKTMPLYFPYSKQTKKNVANRFDVDQEEKGEVEDKFKDIKIDKHEKVTYQLLNRDMKGRPVIFDAEERVGAKIERQR